MSTSAPVETVRPDATTATVLQLTTNADATYVRNQVDALADLGVRSDVLEVPERSGSSGRSPLDYARFCATVRRHLSPDHDLIHANYGLTIPAAACQRRVPIVTSLVGTDLMGRYGAVTKALTGLCDEVVVVSEEMAGMLPGEATVIPYGIDLEQFRPLDRTEARERVGWTPENRHVLFPYNPSRPVKNYPLAETVVDRAAERLDEPIELEVVTGLDYAEIPYYMNAADALVLTSRREGSPSTVKEALACNVPVVSTPVGDVPERVAGVDHASTGSSVAALTDALCRALEAGGRTNGRDAVRGLSIERTGERILEVYERALSTGSRA